MNAKMQYQLTAADLNLILSLARTGKLAAASERLQLDSSTLFRSLQRIERGLGITLFERSRSGYAANELAVKLAEQAELIETALEAARSTAQLAPEKVTGRVRLTTTDTILHGLVAPALLSLQGQHPLLNFDLHTGNELASLTLRDADIALRATRKPPAHLIGRNLGPIRAAVYAGANTGYTAEDIASGRAPWIGPDDAMPEHPSVVWRKKRFPSLEPFYRVSSIMAVMDLIADGLGVGVVPVFLAHRQAKLIQMTDELPECETELWLLTHTESRHLRRINTVFAHLANNIVLQ
jgi:DNA-binding transcriptional LysR family regulator